MSDIGKSERATQSRVISLFKNQLGYRYLGDWRDRDGNTNIEENLLADHLKNRHSAAQIAAAIYKLQTEATNHTRNLYGNKNVSPSNDATPLCLGCSEQSSSLPGQPNNEYLRYRREAHHHGHRYMHP